MSAASLAHAERVLLTAVNANPRTAIKGSVRLDGFALDWTEKTRGGPVARSACVNRYDVLDVLADSLESGQRVTE